MRIALALLAAIVVHSRAGSAPAPPPPVIADAHLVGRWDYAYSSCPDGWIFFNSDQTYCSRHYPGDSPSHFGLWYVERGGLLVLTEWHAHFLDNPPTVYRVQLDGSVYPTTTGRDQCGRAYRFSNPRRDP